MESKGDMRLQRHLVFTKVMKLQSKRRGCSPGTLRPCVRYLTFCKAGIKYMCFKCIFSYGQERGGRWDESGWRMNWEIGVGMYTPLILCIK